MAGTFTQLHIHFVFAVKYREAVIQLDWENELHLYITGIVQNIGHKMLAINSVPDHLHFLAGIDPKQSISDIMCLVKGESSEFVNKKGFIPNKFHWQGGYGAFSVSHSAIDKVVKYILNQKEHHKQKTFREEYIGLLKAEDIIFDEKYIFHELMDI